MARATWKSRRRECSAPSAKAQLSIEWASTIPARKFLRRNFPSGKNQAAGRNRPVGINLGKSKITPLEKAAEDYANSFRVLRDLADFFVVNVSSPNTPNLRRLQDKAALDEILAAIQEVQSPKPILVKVAPDLSFEALDEILELVLPRSIGGIVATNTTISRPQTNNSASQKIYSETGGLSGKPLQARSTEIIRHIFKQTQRPIAHHRRRRNFQCGRRLGKNRGGRVACPDLHRPCF